MSVAEGGAGVRTLAEVTAEVMRRAGKLHPLEDVLPDDAKTIMASLTSLDRDEWAAAWCRSGLAYEQQADTLAKAGRKAAETRALYALAFEYCRTGRYPTASTVGKQEAYRHSVRCFRKAAALARRPMAIVEIPFKGARLVGYLQTPEGKSRPPIVVHWGGVDGWKEDRERQSRILHDAGLATLTIDMPGSGESPVKFAAPDAEATFVAWLDHLAKRKDVDGGRVGLWGGSFGAYWAARLAHTQHARVGAAVFHGGNVHLGFQRDWLVPAFTTGGATYLFGAASLLEARGQAMGTSTMEEFLAIAPTLSLLEMGLLDGPSAPLLCLNGKLDDQAPVGDIHLLAEHGRPKAVRIYPQGRHMGRTPGMDEADIFRLIARWLAEQLHA